MYPNWIFFLLKALTVSYKETIIEVSKQETREVSSYDIHKTKKNQE